MIERVVEGLPDVVLSVDVVLIDIVLHFNASIHILELRVVVERNRGERTEKIRVNSSGGSKAIPLFLILLLG